jgi:hypothetical protein
MLTTKTPRPIYNNSEIRNAKSETISNVQNTNDQNENCRLWRQISICFEFLNFEFVSNFDIRASCFLSLCALVAIFIAEVQP